MTLHAKQPLDEAIGAGTEELVPLILLSDASAFAQGVVQEMGRLLVGPRSKLLVCVEYPESQHALERVLDSAFQMHIHPLRLWEGQLPWVVLVADLQGDGVREALPGLLRQWAGRGFVIPFIRGDLSVPEWAELVKSLGTLPGPVFLLSSQGVVIRDDAVLARGVAAHAFASWSSYIQEKDGLWRKALGLTGDGRIYGLGMAFDQPDWRFHGFAWQGDALRELARQWSMQGGSADRPDYPDALDLAREITPSDNYIAKREHDEQIGALQMGQVAISYAFLQSPVIPEFRSAKRGDALPLRMQRLAKFREFLFLSERQAVGRLAAQQTRRWQQRLRSKMLKSVVFPAAPLGCLRWIRSTFEHWGRYLETLAATRVRPASQVRSFEDNIGRLTSREARRPVLSSLLLRTVLIAVGSVWTVWGTFFWATRSQPWNDPSMARILFFTVGGLLLLLVLAVGQFALMQAACVRAEQLTRSDLLAEFLAGVVAQIRNLLVRRVEVLQNELRHWSDSLEKLLAWTEELAAGRGVAPAVRPGNGNPRFEPGALTLLQTELQPGLVTRVHKAMAEEMTQDARWPFFETSVWRERLVSLVEREVAEQIARVPYDQCVQVARWTDTTRRFLLHDLANDARQPAFGVPMAERAVVLVLASAAWKAQAAGDTALQVTGHSLPFLGAVSAVPLAPVEMAMEGL